MLPKPQRMAAQWQSGHHQLAYLIGYQAHTSLRVSISFRYFIRMSQLYDSSYFEVAKQTYYLSSNIHNKLGLNRRIYLWSDSPTRNNYSLYYNHPNKDLLDFFFVSFCGLRGPFLNYKITVRLSTFINIISNCDTIHVRQCISRWLSNTPIEWSYIRHCQVYLQGNTLQQFSHSMKAFIIIQIQKK